MLNLVRGAHGIGAALILSTSLALLAQEFHGDERARAFGIFGSVLGVGAALGPFLGGFIIDTLGWRWAFLINVPVTLAMIVLTLWRVAESRNPEGCSIDWGGFVTFTLAAFLLVYGLVSGQERAGNGFAISAVVAFAAFLVIERRGRCPMVELSLFRNPTFVGACIAPIVLAISFWGVFLYTPLYLQGVLGYSPFEAGAALLPFAVPLFVMAPVGGWLATRIPAHMLLAAGQLLVGLGALWLWLVVTAPDATWTAFLGGALLAGAGTGLINGQISNVAITAVSDERSGMASGISGTMRQIGIALSFAGLGAIFFRQTTNKFLELSADAVAVRGRANGLASSVASGDIRGAAETLPPELQNAFVGWANASFHSGFHRIMLVAAIVGIVGAGVTYLLVRSGQSVL